ncbi:MAG: peptidase dimerization domain-containing protein [Bacillus subtilis]|nr:peptidase dimerization domain-containing protein [Bacillus subtilis]
MVIAADQTGNGKGRFRQGRNRPDGQHSRVSSGTGKHLIAMDAHIDTVGIGQHQKLDLRSLRRAWRTDELIGGRGGSDQEGGMASMVYAGKIIKDLGLERRLHAARHRHGAGRRLRRPVLAIPDRTRQDQARVRRHHRADRSARSTAATAAGWKSESTCRASPATAAAPERGDNAIFKMAPILLELQELHKHLKDDPFLGKGSLTVSEIFYSSPSRCAVADGCSISIDRRLTAGETYQSAIARNRKFTFGHQSQSESRNVRLRARFVYRIGLSDQSILPDLGARAGPPGA